MILGATPTTAARQPIIVSAREHVDLAPLALQRFDMSRRLITSLIVSMATGVLDVWIGEFTTLPAGSTPDFRFQSGIGPQQIWLPPRDWFFTLANPLALQNSQGNVMFLGGG